jgi:hypothetical protein
MKIILTTIALGFLCSCASSSQLRELKSLKCERLARQLLSIRSSAAEESTLQLLENLKSKGFPTEALLILSEISKSNSEFSESEYNTASLSVILSVLKNQDCYESSHEKIEKEQDSASFIKINSKPL